MKVIKKGPDPKPYRWECWECKSLIEAEIGEGRFVADPRDGDCIVFMCPVCKREEWVLDKEAKP